MKIYKTAQNFEIVPQNPKAQNDPNVQLQNLQHSQQALEYFKNIVEKTERILTEMRALEDEFELGDIGLRTQFTQQIKAAAQQTQAFNLLAQMNLISSVDNLLDQNELNNINNLINTNISTISDQYKAQQQGQQGGYGMQGGMQTQ